MFTISTSLNIAHRNTRIHSILLNELVYLGRTGEFVRDNRTLRVLLNILVLSAPLKVTEALENEFNGPIITDAS